MRKSTSYKGAKQKKKNKALRKVIFLWSGLAILVFVFILPFFVISQNKQDQNKSAHADAITNPDLYGVAAHLNSMNSTELSTTMDGMQAMGVRWIRTDFEWRDIQSGGPTSYNWTNYDPGVQAANAHGIKILGILDLTPQWELAAGCTDTSYCPPKSAADFATFATAVVNRYAPMGVHTWEIWNEPNLGNGQWPRFTVAGYTALLKAAYPAIKKADPNAIVLTGGTAPAATDANDYSPTDWLSGIYANGGKGYFDAVAHHPYCYDVTTTYGCPLNSVQSWSAWSQMQDTNPSLRSIMIANGDGNKKIWATEFGSPTSGTPSVTEAEQAQMVHDAYTQFSSFSWAGPLFWYDFIDDCTDPTNVECNFGLIRADYSQKPAYAAYQSLALAGQSSTVTPTTIPTTTALPTAVPIQQGSTRVVSLSETGSQRRNPFHITFTLQTTGSLPVSNLIVAIRNGTNANEDMGIATNYTLRGSQSFTGSKTLPPGRYTYWVAYYYNGSWVNVFPSKTFTIR